MFFQGSVSSTKAENKPWWRLSGFPEVWIVSVNVFNRADCCGERLNGAQLAVGKSSIPYDDQGVNVVCADSIIIPTGGACSVGE
jgi:hypothetical protein